MSKAAAISDEKILADYDRLSPKRKKEVGDFIAYLRVKEELEATKRIASSKIYLKAFSVIPK